jgi:DeoR family transcriptional regulator, aga operon transcriptional repressor
VPLASHKPFVAQADDGRAPLTIDRRRQIAELIAARGTVRVVDLSKLFGVSGMTIRNDLERLAHEGVLVRDHGGAVARTYTSLSAAFDQRALLNLEAKERIGQAAATLVRAGETIMLDAGSTLMEMVKRLPNLSPLTIITNALNVAMRVASLPGVHVVQAGGSLSPETISTVGPLAERDLRDLLVDRVFLGTHAFELEMGLSDVSIEVARVKSAMISASKQVVLLADSSKFPTRAFARVAPLSAIHCLITDTGFPDDAARQLTAAGIEVQRV